MVHVWVEDMEAVVRGVEVVDTGAVVRGVEVVDTGVVVWVVVEGGMAVFFLKNEVSWPA